MEQLKHCDDAQNALAYISMVCAMHGVANKNERIEIQALAKTKEKTILD
tara:strand:+ start:317 stop:463 length:147 start_codon:yes stop_codon:yes gene_type:complete